MHICISDQKNSFTSWKAQITNGLWRILRSLCNVQYVSLSPERLQSTPVLLATSSARDVDPKLNFVQPVELRTTSQ